MALLEVCGSLSASVLPLCRETIGAVGDPGQGDTDTDGRAKARRARDNYGTFHVGLGYTRLHLPLHLSVADEAPRMPRMKDMSGQQYAEYF